MSAVKDVIEKSLSDDMKDFEFKSPLVSKYPLKDIENIQFGLASPEDIVKQSVCKIESSKLNGPGSVYDPRMGSMEQDEPCVSCELTPKECPGHFGHIELHTFVLHPMFMRYITNFLKCLCVKCYRVVLTENHLQLDGITRFHGESRFEKAVERLDKVDSCYYCESPKPKITFQQKTSDICMKFREKKIIISDAEVKKIFDNVPDEDVRLLGFEPRFMHPKNLVISVLPVIPPRARPYVIADNVTCDDDLTMQYIEIVKSNKNLIDNSVTDAKRIKSIQTLKFRIKTLMNNSQAKARHTNNRPIKGIKERLSGKDGLIRSNLMGKRRNQSGRSVISADPTVRTDELVVPEKIASNLTMPETVASFNINALQKIVDEDKANFVIKKSNGSRMNLKYASVKKGTQLLWGDRVIRGHRIIDPFAYNPLASYKEKEFELKAGDKIKRGDTIITDIDLTKKKDFKLEIGDIVERHLKNGDVVLFNRQPTLHKASMLAKRIVIRPGRTFRFNLASTKSFNADFDGDEMNIFAPQDLDARAELLNLSTTKHNIMTSQSTKNIICITQDSLLGSYLLTNKDTDLGKAKFFDICMKGDGWTCEYILKRLDDIEKIKKKYGYTFPLFCGKSLFSMMFPENLNYTKKNDARKDEPVVKIIKGVLVEGALTKANLGQAHNSIIHVLHKEYSMDKAIDFINNCQFISNQFLVHHSFSVGIKDCIVNIADKTEDIAYKCFIEAKDTEATVSHERIKELKIGAILDKARDLSMKLAKGKLDKDNAFVATVTSGSKGEYFNITQITSMLGQQMHMGQRIQKTLNRGKRTLPHYPKERLTIEQEFESRGFIKHSFLHGLNPQEFIYHAMTGREGCSDTAMKSVIWSTTIVIIENNKPIYTEIGKWIDNLLENNKDKIKNYSEKQMELLDTKNIFIPTTDENGVVSWGEITAITRHDPGMQLYEIKTKGGREVTVTESKSLIIWNKHKKKFEEVLTPDIKVGDFVPVTAQLSTPPIIKKYIDVCEYLPKNEYVYGTDYNKAKNMIKNAMVNRNKIANKWWENNNLQNFTLPFNKKSTFQRSVKKVSQNIFDGFVYPYKTIRKNTLFPEKFELNEENGIFIGLFLAEGNIDNYSLKISNNNENIKNFVKNWFNKYNINWQEETKINKIGGLSTTITGYCGVLSYFFNKLMGNGSHNKHVPTESFISSDEFIIGILNGYFSGDGCVTKNSIEACSVSKRLIEGISMLCSRIGIFGKITKTEIKKNNLGTKNIKPSYYLKITANWAKKFSEKITLLEEKKNKKMKEKVWINKSLSFEYHNDIVLDEIVEINLVDIKDHPKVYDLTIPSTLNFGLANGLQVRDTAQSGYIQRKMVKVLEDVQVKYDGTVRNTNGWVVQWAYGGDGFDRSESSFNKDGVFFADVSKIADRLNNDHEIKNNL